MCWVFILCMYLFIGKLILDIHFQWALQCLQFPLTRIWDINTGLNINYVAVSNLKIYIF